MATQNGMADQRPTPGEGRSVLRSRHGSWGNAKLPRYSSALCRCRCRRLPLSRLPAALPLCLTVAFTPFVATEVANSRVSALDNPLDGATACQSRQDSNMKNQSSGHTRTDTSTWTIKLTSTLCCPAMYATTQLTPTRICYGEASTGQPGWYAPYLGTMYANPRQHLHQSPQDGGTMTQDIIFCTRYNTMLSVCVIAWTTRMISEVDMSSLALVH